MRGAQLLTKTLKRAGVKTIFSLSGNQIMPIYDACIDAGIKIVHTRHEAAAVYMADAWAQITGEIGVALVAGGPGFANSLSPVFSAKHAESPILLLSGDSALSEDGLGGFQELDQLMMTQPLVKLGLRPKKVDDLANHTIELIRLAHKGRPGPVHMALPFDLLNQSTDTQHPSSPLETKPKITTPTITPIVDALRASQRPIIFTGPQCNETRAAELLAAIRNKAGIPIISMESPRGLNDPALGSFKDLYKQADLIVLIGKKIDFTLGFGQSTVLPGTTKIIVVDPEPEVLKHAEKQLQERLGYQLLANSPDVLRALEKEIHPVSHHSAWYAKVTKHLQNRAYIENKSQVNTSGSLSSHYVCTEIQSFLQSQPDTILISDGGEFGQWVQATCHAKKRIINGTSGAIGGGLPYAIAAKLAHPQATVVVAMGDGTAGFHLAEFDTASREKTSFTVIIGNDHKWNAEHLIQLENYGEDRLIGCDLDQSTDYAAAAGALGAQGYRVTTKQELADAFKQAESNQQVTCINAHITGEPAPSYHPA